MTTLLGPRGQALVLVILTVVAPSHISAKPGHSQPLVFDKEPENVVVLPHEAAVLDCDAGGHRTDAIIKWKRDGEVISFPDSNNRRQLLANGSLYISKVFHSKSNRPDEGIYQCELTVPGVGTIVSRTATLRIASLAQSFSREPKDQFVFLSNTAAFDCLISAVPKDQVQVDWFKDEQPLRLNHRMKILPSGLLEIYNIQVSDRGSYHCQVTFVPTQEKKSSQSGMLKLNFALSEEPRAPSFVKNPDDVKEEVGSEVILNCAANGNPEPVITWLKDGATIDLSHLDSRFTKIGKGSLQIRDLQLSDKGTYMCRAENSEDSVDSAAYVDVQMKPRFSEKPSPTLAVERSDVELACEAFGMPEPTVQWYKNGDLLIESDYFQIVRGSHLKIMGLVAGDSGMYQCFASNSVGNVQASAELKVVSKDFKAKSQAPIFQKGPSAPRDLRAVIVSTRFVTLSWNRPANENGGILGYSVFYKRSGSDRERVLNSTGGNLEEINVQGLLPGRQYEVRVVAFNQHGPGDSSTPLMVSTQQQLDVPGTVSDFQARATSAFSILVSWQRPEGDTNVDHYKLYYRMVDELKVHSLDVYQLQHHLTDLREFTEYTFWVSGFNDNGEGAFSSEITTRTQSDLPADPPQNVTLEPASSKSFIVRWEPPPKESQNGIITGYKIRWRKASVKGRGEMVTTDGSRRLYAVTDLQNGMEYAVKMAALTVNGTGPWTSWETVSTFDVDLDESVVPDQPSSLFTKSRSNEITVEWKAPANNKILVRGFKVGWGIGIPDEYTTIVDDKQRSFTVKNLRTSSEYVITVRAFNEVGDGRASYDTIWTKDKSFDEEETTQVLQPPYGLHARILSAKTALLTWMDSSLPSNQWVADERYYVVRYTSTKYPHSHGKPRHQYRNASDLNTMLDDLRANTEYEFVVKVVNGRRQSEWSMVTLNKTEESAPSSPPRDLKVKPDASGKPGLAILTWRLPKLPNGRINGYLVMYTADKRAEEREWYVEAVVGDETTAVLQNLQPGTKYYFKVGARNSKGYGPYSPIESFILPSSNAVISSTGNPANERKGNEVNPIILYAIAGVGAGILLVLIIAAAILIHRCGQQSGAAAVVAADRMNKNSYISAEGSLSSGLTHTHKGDRLNPPEMWLAHDQLELKSMVDDYCCSHDGNDTGETSIARSTPIGVGGGMSSGTTDLDGGSSIAASSIDRGRNHHHFVHPYSGTESEVSFSVAGSSTGVSRLSVCKQPMASSTPNHLLPLRGPTRVAAINAKPRLQRYLSGESMTSGSHPGSVCNGSVTYVKSHFNSLSPPEEGSFPSFGQSPGQVYDPTSSERSGATSTIEEHWPSASGESSASFPVAVAPPQLPPTYLSSALSTSSADSSSGTSGATRSSGGSKDPKAKLLGRPHHMGRNHHHHNQQQQQQQQQQQPSSPLKRHVHQSPSHNVGDQAESSHNPNLDNLGGTPLHSGLLPSVAIRSPGVLHPQGGPCDCLTHPAMPSLSTEDLNAEMKNLEGLMKDLSTISKPGQT